MPWRGPSYPGEFPSLGPVVADWIETCCAIPDRHVRGDPFVLSDEQYTHLAWYYRLHPDATVNVDEPAAPFAYNGGIIVRPHKWGKSPLDAAMICAQAVGPVLFDGWDANGEPVGRPWDTPHIQVSGPSEDNTANIWRALMPMVQLGQVAEFIQDVGLTQVYLPGGGLIERVTASAVSRLGQRITYIAMDQLESWLERNGGHRLADAQRRNLAGTGGRWHAAANAWDPAEQSTVQQDHEAVQSGAIADVYFDFPDGPPGSWLNKAERRKVLRAAYHGSPWVDLERIESECLRLHAKNDPRQAERWFGNRIVAGAARAFDLDVFKPLRDDEQTIPPGAWVTGGFDGAMTRDGTGLVITDVRTGRQEVAGYWERPAGLPEGEPWSVPVGEVDDVVAHVMATYKVWRLNADPPHWQESINTWAGVYGDDVVVLWWTNIRRRMAVALKAWAGDMRPGVMTYGGDHADLLEQHVGNAVRRMTEMRDEDEEGRQTGMRLWLVSKDGPSSPRRIDLAMAACLSWEARGQALRAGVLHTPVYSTAAWQ